MKGSDIMLNIIQLKKIDKKDVIDSLKEQLDCMNTHQFEVLKKTLNKKGTFDNVYKRKLQEL